MTVLFADMAGFTARAELLDPEDVRAILDRYYARLRSEIEAFSGTVEKFIGDAVVAFFGVPIAHGDDPERAMRAALAVRSAVAEMNASDPQLKLEVRLAVNTGEAIVSMTSREIREGMIAGDVVNTASRMQGAAPTNGILVGAETYRATRGLFEFEPIEPLDVKGKLHPVPVWLAIRPRSEPGERRLSTVPMLGRAHELAALGRIFDGVVEERRPHLVTIFGEAGIGKTRLATEFAERLDPRAARILRGRSLPYGASTPYDPFAQHVKQFAAIFASDDAPCAKQKLRDALEGIGVHEATDQVASHLELLTGVGGDEVGDRQILFRAARQFAEALAGQRPTLLVFEDVHWADGGTLDLLELLASRVHDVPLMCVALARPALLVARPAWGGGLPAYTALSLQPLSRAEAIQLAAQLLQRDARNRHELRVVETAEGNPLFIEELAAAAIEQPASKADNLPTTIRDLVSARLDALPPEQRLVLLDAAVVGRVFWRGAVERMTEDGGSVAEALDALESRDLVRQEPRSWIQHEDQFAFKHVLIRDVAYATVPRSRRKQLHATVARFLEQATGEAGATATALAQHWREAGESERALEYLVLAADRAGRGWAKEEAATLYGEALELCAEPERRRELQRKQALALAALVHVPDVRVQILRAEAEPTDA